MFGPDIGSIAIYTSTKSNPMTEVNRLNGEKGNQWFKLDTDIGIIPQNQEWVRIIIEAVIGAGFLGKKKTHLSFSMIFFISYLFS